MSLLWGVGAVVLTGAAFGCGDDDAIVADAGDDMRMAPDDASPVEDAEVPVDAAPDASPDDAGTPAVARSMWVSVGSQARIAAVELGADGRMSARVGMDLTLSERPGALAYGPESRRLYAGLRDGAIATVDLASGMVLADTPDTGNPVYLALDADETTLISAYFGDDLLRAHAVGGSPPFAQTDTEDSADEPHAATRGPSGFFYVPHRNGDTIHWYSVDGDGTIALEGQVASMAGEGPRHIAFHPSGTYAYVIMEYADSVVLHDVGADGSLTRRESYPTLPAGFDGDSNTCADVHVTPDGRALYGSNRGHDSLAMYTIESDGALTSLGTIDTEARPREFAMSPDGRFVVVAGQDSGFLQSYRVGADGALSSIERLEIAGDLRWVIIE